MGRVEYFHSLWKVLHTQGQLNQDFPQIVNQDGVLAGPEQDAAGRHCLYQPLRELHRRGCSSQGSPPYGGSSLVPVSSNEPNVVWSAWLYDLRDWVHGLHR